MILKYQMSGKCCKICWDSFLIDDSLSWCKECVKKYPLFLSFSDKDKLLTVIETGISLNYLHNQKILTKLNESDDSLEFSDDLVHEYLYADDGIYLKYGDLIDTPLNEVEYSKKLFSPWRFKFLLSQLDDDSNEFIVKKYHEYLIEDMRDRNKLRI